MTAITTPEAAPGPAAKTPEWYEARRIGVTATEARDLAKGYKSNRTKILREKLTGARLDLSGNQYVEYGNLREPIIARWIEARFGIPASDALYVNLADPRRLATPDGVQVDPFGTVLVSETKTSKHDLTPGNIVDGVLVLTKGLGGKWYLPDNHFADTGYYDQMQWQMFVLGAQRTLFAWEQHDSDWSGWPERAPKTLTPEPGWCWVTRDEKRIAELIAIVDEFMLELAEAFTALAAGDESAIPEGPSDPAEYERRARIRELGHTVIAQRKLEAAAAKAKTEAWNELQILLAEERDFIDEGDEDLRVSVTTSITTKKVVNRERMLKRAPQLVERYEKLVERYTESVATPKTTLTVTEPKGK